MRKGTLVIAAMGMGAMTLLAVLANHYLEINPTIKALVELRTVARGAYGERLVQLTWAPPPAPRPGAEGHGLRAVFRPTLEPASPTREQQANQLGDWLLAQWNAPDLPPLGFVDVKGFMDGDGAWIRVTPRRGRGAIAPPRTSGYPPRPPAPAPAPPPGESHR